MVKPTDMETRGLDPDMVGFLSKIGNDSVIKGSELLFSSKLIR